MSMHPGWHLISLRRDCGAKARTAVRATLIIGCAASALLTARDASAVSLSFQDPAGGWTYAFEGAAAAAGSSSTMDEFDALDGTWDRTSGGDSWAGDGLGGVLAPATNPPGGISALTDGPTTFIRIQDPGDPRDATPDAFPDVSNVGSNRRVYVGHSIQADGAAPTDFLDTGVTLSFRARLATAATGIIDDQYPDTATGTTPGENRTVAPGTPWQAEGNGGLVHDGGKGDFSIRQATGDKIISFSLGLESEGKSDEQPFGTTGLNMNSINPANVAASSGTVDPYQSEGATNVLALSSITDWHEFWITIVADASQMGGTHRVDIYVDGSLTPNTFYVTAGNGNDYGIDYIGMGSGATPQQNAFDVDFFAYKIGAHAPVPEPTALAMGVLGALSSLLVARRRRS